MLAIVPRRISGVLAAIALGLVSVSLSTRLLARALEIERGPLVMLANLFDVRREQNIPTWFAVCLLLLCGLLALLIAAAQQRRDRWRWLWVGLGVIFILLSLDELVSIHEYGNGLMRRFIPANGLFRFAWVIPGIAVVVAFGLTYLRFWWRLPARIRLLIAAAGLLYCGGALGVEMISGVVASRHGPDSLPTWLVTQCEELFELSGAILLLHALMSYAAGYLEFRLVFVEERSPSDLPVGVAHSLGD